MTALYIRLLYETGHIYSIETRIWHFPKLCLYHADSNQKAAWQSFLGTCRFIFRGHCVPQQLLEFIHLFCMGIRDRSVQQECLSMSMYVPLAKGTAQSPHCRPEKGLFKAGEEIWMITDENGENKKEGQDKMEDGSHMVQDFLWYRYQTNKEN